MGKGRTSNLELLSHVFLQLVLCHIYTAPSPRVQKVFPPFRHHVPAPRGGLHDLGYLVLALALPIVALARIALVALARIARRVRAFPLACAFAFALAFIFRAHDQRWHVIRRILAEPLLDEIRPWVLHPLRGARVRAEEGTRVGNALTRYRGKRLNRNV